jgi:hypothetical protein
MKLNVLRFIAGVLVGAATLWSVESHAMGGGFHGGMMGGGGFRGGMMGNRFLVFHGGNFNRGMMGGRSFPITAFNRQHFAFFPHRRHFVVFGGSQFFPAFYRAGYASGYGGDYAADYGADYCVWQKVWVTYGGWRWRQVCGNNGY